MNDPRLVRRIAEALHSFGCDCDDWSEEDADPGHNYLGWAQVAVDAVVAHTAAVEVPRWQKTLERLANAECETLATGVVTTADQSPAITDLLAALVFRLNRTFRPEAPVDHDFSFVFVAADEVAEVHGRWQLEISDAPGGYALALVGRTSNGG